MNYDDLISEGVHPVFLSQLFARLQPHSPQLPLRSQSIPLSNATPEPPQLRQPPPAPVTNTGIAADVDNFLDTLEPTINHKKRRPQEDIKTSPPKRRTFGAPQKQLVIDVSDDEDASSNDSGEEKPEPKLEPRKPVRPTVRIPDRPSLKQQVPYSLNLG